MNKTFLKNSFRHSIFAEYMMLMTAILLPMGMAIAYYVLTQVNQEMEHRSLDALEQLATAKVAMINHEIDQHLKELEVFADTESAEDAMLDLSDVFHSQGVDSEAYKKLRRSYQPVFDEFIERGDYNNMFLMDMHGHIVYALKHQAYFANHVSKEENENKGLMQVFQQSLEHMQATNSSFEYDPSSQKIVAFEAVPIFDKGKILGVLALEFHNHTIQDVVSNYMGLGTTGEVVVGRRDGDHILITAPLRHDQKSAFHRTIDMHALNARPIREASQGKTGRAKLKDWRHKEVLAAWQYIPALQWGMVVKIDTEEAFGGWYQLRTSLLLYSTLALLLCYVVLFIFTRRITRPLEKLTQMSRDIASGKDDVVLPTWNGRGNEVAVLSHVFGMMLHELQLSKQSLQETSDALAEHNRSLNQRVYEQTARICAVLDCTTDGIITIDQHGMVERANPAACTMFGYTEAEFSTLPFIKLLPEQCHTEYTNLLIHQQSFHDAYARKGIKALKKSQATIQIELSISDMQLDEHCAFLATIRDVTERSDLEYQQSLLMEGMNHAHDAIMVTDAQGVIEYVNPAFQRLSGYSESELLGNKPSMVKSGDMPKAFYEEMWATLLRGDVWNRAFMNQHKNGSLYEVEQLISPIMDEHHDIVGFTSVQHDITGEKKKKEKLEHVQRLESLGVLAGGIAHDFNNLLTVIMGNASWAKMKLDSFSPVAPLLSNIEDASERAAALCKQMLAYSGKGKFIVKPIDLTQMVREMMNLLEVSIDKNVVMRLNLSEQLLPIEADVAQMQQVVMNLVINASEAIDKHSGTLTLYTGVVDIDDAYIQTTYIDSGLTAGRYVALEVSDTGCGMSEETQKKLFDPFFTTKFTGRGLGMSAILGIIRGHHGGIKVYSELGKGTTFKILFPCSTSQEVEEQVTLAVPVQTQGKGTILIIDDEETIRVTASMMLEDFGFDTLTAQDGEEGVSVFSAHQDDISAVLLDMTMPKMNGEDCFRELRALQPDVTVILSSGYNEQDATNRFAGKGLAGFIQKPYRAEALRDMFLKVLGQ